MRVNWTEPALEALADLHNHLRQEAPWYAARFVEQLVGAVDQLEQFPLSGRRVPEAENEAIRELIFHGYRIIYWVVNDDRLDVIGLLHGRRDLANPTNQPW